MVQGPAWMGPTRQPEQCKSHTGQRCWVSLPHAASSWAEGSLLLSVDPAVKCHWLPEA